MRYIVNDKDLSQQAKEYLSQIRKTDRLIDRLVDTAATMRSNLTAIKCELQPDRTQAAGPKNALEETMAKIIDLEADINRRIDKLVDDKAEALCRIGNVPDRDQQNILIARYVEGRKWEKIAIKLHFSIAQTYRIHGAALLAFAKRNPDILKDDSKRECDP